MNIFVGLGNPGSDYANHRHNIGFMAVDTIAAAHGFATERKKFHALIRDGVLPGGAGAGKILIVKPQTFMNESGRSVSEVVKFYKVTPAQVIVFHDELDLAPGKMRTKIGGGHAGHNGLRSIAAHIGNEFIRVRLGIGHPGDKSRVHNHVLGNFAKADSAWRDPLLDTIAKHAGLLAGNSDLARFQSLVANDLNGKTAPTSPSATGPSPKRAHQSGKGPTGSQTNESAISPPGPFRDALMKLLPGRGKNDKE